MKAIVMAGGQGTRLRPLTEGRPKPMMELLGRPVLAWTVEHLRQCGFEDICFTLRYLSETIQEAFGDGRDYGVSIRHLVETEPLGTAGGVGACRDFTAGEDVLVISGDGVCDFDLRRLMEFHRERGAEVTIGLAHHPEPTAFGLVLTDREGRVTGFAEKPAWERVLTDRVNTGIYVLSPSVLDAIPGGTEVDFGKDLFPRLLREGRRLYALELEGYWCDIGSPEAYRRCCLDAVSGKIKLDLGVPEREPGVFAASELDGVTVTPPVYVGEGCTVEPGARLGPGAVVGPGSRIGPGCEVRDSVVNGARLGPDCRLEGAILGRDADLGARVRLEPGSVAGDGAELGEGCSIGQNVLIWGGRAIPAGRRVTHSVTDDTPLEAAAFTDGWHLRGRFGSGLTPDLALDLGAALGTWGRVGTAHTGGRAARLLAEALGCGIAWSGGERCAADCDFEAELAAAVRLFALDGAAFVRDTGGDVTVTFLERNGVPLGPAKRRELEAALTGAAARRTGPLGEVTALTGAARAYISGVTEELRALTDIRCPISLAVTGTGAENRALRCVLAGLGCEVREAAPGVPAFRVEPGGFDLTATDERGRELDSLHTLALTAEAAMRLGARELPGIPELPEAVSRLAVRYGCKLLPVTEPTGAALQARCRLLRDGVLGAAVIVSTMAQDRAELARLRDSLPPFRVEERRVELRGSRARAMRLMASMSAEFAADLTAGLTLRDDRGVLRVAPAFDGSALTLRAEADSGESAAALCADCERLARETEAGDP